VGLKFGVGFFYTTSYGWISFIW